MNSFVVDTNVFLRLILNDVPKQADKAEKLLKQAKAHKINLTVPQIIIFEIEYALTKYYGFPKDQVIDKLTSIVSAKYLTCQNREIFNKAIELYKGINLSLVDCFLAAYADKIEGKTFSFDKNLNKLLKSKQ